VRRPSLGCHRSQRKVATDLKTCYLVRRPRRVLSLATVQRALRLSEIRFRQNIENEKSTQPPSHPEYDLPCLTSHPETKTSLLLDGFEANPNISRAVRAIQASQPDSSRSQISVSAL
jgi:hypothetical protein